MNNLKRVLSLALASVMLIGMMVVGASAADFSDAEEIQHKEAVDVLVALDVINGKEDGSYFAPEDNVTRGEMAKMIAVAMKGGNDVNTGTKGVPSFTDISGHWAESYIEYCYDLGIISGRGDGTFDPNANVTGTEVTKMVLSALGYDADAYKLKGAQWATRTDELARKANPQLYEDLSGVVLNVAATRDTAAQIIWNGLQNNTVEVSPDQNTNSGEVTWKYSTKDTPTLLKARYNGQIWVGTFDGNYDMSSALTAKAGEITVNGKIQNSSVNNTPAAFPSDLPISYIGEEVKVIFKDGNGGTSNKPDNKDTIYGTFVTGTTQVYWTTKADIKKAADVTANDKIKFNGVEYTVGTAPSDDYVAIVRDYGATTPAATDVVAKDTNLKKTFSDDLRKGQNSDKVKFVTDANGKIVKAYVETQNFGYISSINGDKITINNVGTINISDNDVYEDAKKYDVVNYTKFYKSNKDDAFFTVTKAESVTGQMTAYKNNTTDEEAGHWKNITIDGTTYQFEDEKLVSVTIDSTTTEDSVSDDDIGEEFTAYLVNGKRVAYLVQDTDSAAKLAVVVETDIANKKLNANMSKAEVRLLLADGTKVTAKLHEDSEIYKSTEDQNGKLQMYTKSENLQTGDLPVGTIVRYSVNSNGEYKIIEIVADDHNGYTLVAPTAALAGNTEVYDKDTKSVSVSTSNADPRSWNVTSGDAILFAGAVDASDSDWKVYNLRSLNDVKVPTTEFRTSIEKNFAYVMKDGKAIAAFLQTTKRPSGSASATVYGIVSGFNKTITVNGDSYDQYTVENDSDSYTVLLSVADSAKDGSLKRKDGQLVSFEPTSDNIYDFEDINIFTGTAYDDENGLATWVKEYNAGDKTLTYYTNIADKTVKTLAVDDDVVISYVNVDDGEAGSDVGVSEYDETTGYRNVLLVKDTDSDKIVAILVESSREADIIGADITLTALDATTKKQTATAVGFTSSAAPTVKVYDTEADRKAGTTVSATGSATATTAGEITYSATQGSGEKTYYVTISWTSDDGMVVTKDTTVKLAGAV